MVRQKNRQQDNNLNNIFCTTDKKSVVHKIKTHRTKANIN